MHLCPTWKKRAYPIIDVSSFFGAATAHFWLENAWITVVIWKKGRSDTKFWSAFSVFDHCLYIYSVFMLQGICFEWGNHTSHPNWLWESTSQVCMGTWIREPVKWRIKNYTRVFEWVKLLAQKICSTLDFFFISHKLRKEFL